MTWQAFSLPKRHHSAEEYEDAFAGDGGKGRFAIADGASESSYAGPWAQLLVEKFIKIPLRPSRTWADWLPPLQQRWARELDGRQLPWYAEAKLELGAFAAFLGLVVGKSRWHATAVGDCCLFQIRQEQLLQAFPMDRSSDFGTQPRLVGARTTSPETIDQQQIQTTGDWQAGDRFLLSTDALAEWFLRQNEEGSNPWQAVEPLVAESAGGEGFAAWVDGLREHEGLRNDDVTLLVVDITLKE